MLKIVEVKKSFGAVDVLKGININCQDGQINGLVGVNGAGKSTLFQSIVGLLDCIGTIEWTGGQIKNHCGFLPTDPPMMTRITGQEYLRLITQARGIDIDDFQSKNIFDLPLDRFIENYSTGMKKKIALTGILLQKNQIFIFDEPFNGLDLQSNMMVIEIIKQLKVKQKIILVSSHIFSLLKDLCDQVHYLQEGIIKEVVDRSNFDNLEKQMKDDGYQKRVEALID